MRHASPLGDRMHEATAAQLVLASSMVVYGEGRYTCLAHGDVQPVPRSLTGLDRGEFENRCPECGGVLRWGTVDESARLDPRSPTPTSTGVFDVAWRGGHARTPGDDVGAGLGLAIVKASCEAHRGTVAVTNRSPGCQFVVTIPA